MSPEIPPAQFRFVRYWVDKAIFKELPRETPKDGEQKPERIPTQIVINVGAGVNEDLKRGQLTLEAKVTPDPKWRPYEIEVAVTGQFEAASDEVTSEQLNMFFRMNVPIILFPYVREVVHRITSDGRYGQVKIDPMNLQLPLESWKPVESGEKKTTLSLPRDFAATVKALLETPPPPAGDPSTRKRKPTKKKAAPRKRP